MSNSSPSCAMVGESCSPGPSGLCRWCGWYRCSMDCGRAVPELASRCSECHPLACPCEDCLAWEALPDAHAHDDHCAGNVDSDGNCEVCHAGGGDPCPACGGVRYHARWCDVPSDSGGIPQEVEEDETSAQTVRLGRDASIAETGAEWSEHLSKEAA